MSAADTKGALVYETLPVHLQTWLSDQVAHGAYRSIPDALRQLVSERIAERLLDEDDFAWARPTLDAAYADIAQGNVVGVREHNARMDALLASLPGE
jgi:Arc/MetJ-type ribon-helix-helix transcriptional regulator